MSVRKLPSLCGDDSVELICIDATVMDVGRGNYGRFDGQILQQ